MWKRLLWQRSGGHYLFWLSAIYLVVGFANIAYKFTEADYIQMVWFLFLMIPLVVKPVARYLNMRTLWEQ
jgi:hypothetical protein